MKKTRRLGIRANPKAMVYSLPLIASHVGADVAADLVSILTLNSTPTQDLKARVAGQTPSQDEIVMLVDVGTNTEVVVGNAEADGRCVMSGWSCI